MAWAQLELFDFPLRLSIRVNLRLRDVLLASLDVQVVQSVALFMLVNKGLVIASQQNREKAQDEQPENFSRVVEPIEQNFKNIDLRLVMLAG
jgi:hypothetical protein